MFTFVGATWVEVALAFTFCATGAVWLEVCAWPEVGPAEVAVPPICCCVLLWFVLFLFCAEAAAEESLCWLACPPAPAFVADWVDVAEAVAFCSVGAV
jgi:hypothetical protein